MKELSQFLEYAVIFLGNIGNYYVCFLSYFILSLKSHQYQYIPGRPTGIHMFQTIKLIHLLECVSIFFLGSRRPKIRS